METQFHLLLNLQKRDTILNYLLNHDILNALTFLLKTFPNAAKRFRNWCKAQKQIFTKYVNIPLLQK